MTEPTPDQRVLGVFRGTNADMCGCIAHLDSTCGPCWLGRHQDCTADQHGRSDERCPRMSYDERAYEPHPLDDYRAFPQRANRDGTGSIAVLYHCVRCGAYVADRERHDQWHGAIDK